MSNEEEDQGFVVCFSLTNSPKKKTIVPPSPTTQSINHMLFTIPNKKERERERDTKGIGLSSSSHTHTHTQDSIGS